MFRSVDVLLSADFIDRLNTYDEDFCWQYKIRLDNLNDDLKLIDADYEKINVSDFEFKVITDNDEKKRAIEFIKRHEWLGNITQYTTHYFGAYYKDILSGVILMSVPNAFSKLLGDDTHKLERLISRGACISWSPSGLASALVMWSVRWMVKNTEFRLFTAYSDPTAKELGTIYQACNFYYLGNNAGTTTRYINPYTGKIVSDRFFRQKSAYKKYAQELNIEWEKEWTSKNGMCWDNIPDEIELKLREHSKLVQRSSEKIVMPSKHKYAYVLGASKSETKLLRKTFEQRNKTYPYPKERGV